MDKSEGKVHWCFVTIEEAVERVSAQLNTMGFRHSVYHGGLRQDQRLKALIKFRNGTNRIMLATDLAARGLDINGIQHVVHYQIAPEKETFIHRNGRTGRMMNQGIVYLVCTEEDEAPTYLHDLENMEVVVLEEFKKLPKASKWLTIYANAGKKDRINKMDLVGVLMKKGGLKKEDVGLIEVLDHSAYIAILADKAKALLSKINKEKIKKRKVKFSIST